VRKLLTSLKRQGKLIITVPFGETGRERNMRIYDHEKLRELIPNIEVERFFFKPDRYSSRIGTSWKEIDDLEYEDYCKISPTQRVAFVVAVKS